ncbi:MAG: hypothetical protein LBL81_00220, partial [Tannerella sp.]|nr:hypothetical protein [Tannerella sp.]
FTLQLPKGVHLNADSTCLSARLEQGYDLSYSKLDETGSTWLLRIDASPLREAEDSAAVDSFREIADIGLQMDDSLLGKDFLVSFDTINFTLSNGLRLAEGNKSIPIRVASLYGTPVATETVIKPALPVGIRFEGGELLLDTPFAEEVRLFDFNGRLLFQKGKKAGEAVFNLPTGLPRLMLLCGSSGWSRKLYRQGN